MDAIVSSYLPMPLYLFQNKQEKAKYFLLLLFSIFFKFLIRRILKVAAVGGDKGKSSSACTALSGTTKTKYYPCWIRPARVAGWAVLIKGKYLKQSVPGKACTAP